MLRFQHFNPTRSFKSCLRSAYAKEWASAVLQATSPVGLLRRRNKPELRHNLVGVVLSGLADMAPKVPQLRGKAWRHLSVTDEQRTAILKVADKLHACDQLFTDELTLPKEDEQSAYEENPEIAVTDATAEFEEDEDEGPDEVTLDVEVGEPPEACAAVDDVHTDAVDAAEQPTALAKMSRFLALKLVYGAPSPRTLQKVATGSACFSPERSRKADHKPGKRAEARIEGPKSSITPKDEEAATESVLQAWDEEAMYIPDESEHSAGSILSAALPSPVPTELVEDASN